MADLEEDPVTRFCMRWDACLPMLRDNPEWLSYTMRGGAGRSVAEYDGSVQALRLLFHGRWGNYVLEIINMFHIAEATGAKKIYLYRTEMFPFPDDLVLHGIRVFASHVDDDPSEYCLTGNYFSLQTFGRINESLNPARRLELARKYVRPLLVPLPPPDDLIGPDALVIHIRAGDIFQGVEGEGGANYGGPLYIQPPLNFYMAVVHRAFGGDKGRVFIISENSLNPAILPLVKALDAAGHGVTLRLNQDLVTDLSWLFAARQIVFANGTIGIAIAMLSETIEDGYFFRHDGTGTGEPMDLFLGDHIRRHVVLDTDHSYISVGNWRNTADQRQEMVDFPMEQLVWADAQEVAADAGAPENLVIAESSAGGQSRGHDIFDRWSGDVGRGYADAVWQMVTRSRSFTQFRRNPAYRVVLEHLNEAQGRDYLSQITDPNILKIVAESELADSVGNPEVFSYNGARIAPSTLRYAKVMSDILEFFPNLRTMRAIVEVGVGYGGPGRIISEYARLISWDLRSYTLVDLPSVNMLARMYLETMRMWPACRFLTKPELGRDGAWDFAISNYAFSAFARPLQDEYVEIVLKRSRSGYLTMNSGLPGKTDGSGSWTADELMRILPNAAILREEPSTGDGNYILLFGDHVSDLGLTPKDLL